MEVLSLSDADDQMGGTGGDTGPRPGAGKGPSNPEKSHNGDTQGEDDAVTEGSKESFPASDPPGNY